MGDIAIADQDPVQSAITEAVAELNQPDTVATRLSSWYKEVRSNPTKLDSRDEVLRRVEELLDSISTKKSDDQD